MKIIKIEDLTIGFRGVEEEQVVSEFSLEMEQGEIIGIVGESGSGKTMTALSIIGLLPEEAHIFKGKIYFKETELLSVSEKELRKFQGKHIAMVFQEPMTSLNPVLKIGRQVEEPLCIHEKYSKVEKKKKVIQLLKEVEIRNPQKVYNMYPHELSGGMRQRVVIAMALICGAELIIADEPTTALDVTIQAQILELLKRINKERKTSILFISHNLGVVKQLCSKVLVMHQGKIVEQGITEEVFYNPQDTYTKKLLNSIPTRKRRISDE
jgi:ABC-type dipeptide/oligopeptide/nickel transport system, ATPase component